MQDNNKPTLPTFTDGFGRQLDYEGRPMVQGGYHGNVEHVERVPVPKQDALALGHDGLPHHTEPLRWLARHLHKSKPLEELVRKQRYRRKRKSLDNPTDLDKVSHE